MMHFDRVSTKRAGLTVLLTLWTRVTAVNTGGASLPYD